MSPDELARALTALGLVDEHRDVLVRHARPELALTLGGDDVPVGASKVGGVPDLPGDAPWPTDGEGRPLSFVAQLDLASLPHLDDDLPRDGALWVFYDTVRQPPGTEPGDAAGVAVRWSPPVALQRSATPPDAEEFPECSVSATVGWGPPRDPVAWPADESAGMAFVDEWNGKGPEAKLLGHPDTLQEGMEGVCEALARGATPSPTAGRPALDDALRDRWVLLLQLGTDGRARFTFGSGSGRLYVWIARDALRARDFSAARAFVQDT